MEANKDQTLTSVGDSGERRKQQRIKQLGPPRYRSITSPTKTLVLKVYELSLLYIIHLAHL